MTDNWFVTDRKQRFRHSATELTHAIAASRGENYGGVAHNRLRQSRISRSSTVAPSSSERNRST